MNVGGLLTLLAVVIPILALIAGIAAIVQFIDLGEQKGYFKEGAGLFWFIGLFASPLVLGLYVAALPDKRGSSSPSVKDELPSL